MKGLFVARSIISSAIVSAMLLLGPTVQAAPTQAELDEINYAQALKESGYTFPAIEEALQARKETIARTASEKAAKVHAIAGEKAQKTSGSY